MTIVANDSITVSNVNDGTITHTAYANSADGTLDFNPDYKSAVGLDIMNVTSWAKSTSMSGSTYNFSSNADSSFKVTGKGTGGYEVLSKSFPAKVGDKLRFTVRYTNRLEFGLYNGYGLQFVASGAYTESVTQTSKIVLPNSITGSTEYQLEYTATTSNIWMQLNFGGVSDGAQVDFDVKIEVENLTNPVKYAYMGTYSDYTATDSANPSEYTWSRILGEDGISGIIVSSVAPASPQTGQLWQDTSTTPQLVKKWTGSSWVIWELYVENMNVNNLSALSTILGDIDGGTLKLMADDILINGRPKMYGIYQSKLGLISSGPTFETAASGIISDTQMGVVSVNKGEMRFIVTDYTEDLKTLQESGMSDQNNAFIKFASYEGGKDVMTIGSSGDIVFKGNTSQDTQWVTLSSGVKYKFMFSRVYISVDVVGNGGSFMQFGTLPQNLRPVTDQFLIIANQGAGTADDRHIMVRASDGAVVLWTPKSGITYRGEVSFTL